MNVDAILCNHAEAVGNLLYISGGGITTVEAPRGSNPPYRVTLGIGLILTVPWDQSPQQHNIEFELLTEDGRAVEVLSAPGFTGSMKSQFTVTITPSPSLPAGDEQQVCVATNIQAIPLPRFGKYEFVVRVDSREERRLTCRLRPAP